MPRRQPRTAGSARTASLAARGWSLWLVLVLTLLTGCTGPSPSEEQEGLDALPQAVDYVALGDSIAAGAGSDTSYVDEFAERMETELGRDVAVTNLARSGWTSEDLLEALRTDPAVREAVAGADLVTWNVGGNDLLEVLAEIDTGTGEVEDVRPVRAAVERLKTQWDAIVAELVELRRDDSVVLRTMDVYHPFVAEHREAGLFDTLGPFLDEVNGHLAATGGQHGIRVAGVHEAFNGPDGTTDPTSAGLLAPDGLHPSEEGQRLIAELLFNLG